MKELKPIEYRGWQVKFIKFQNGNVRALGFNDAKLYTQYTSETKDEAEKFIKISIDQFEDNMKGWKGKITPLNTKAYEEKY
jgi:uncharacterized lipoprotein YehR (DUF1307 family)